MAVVVAPATVFNPGAPVTGEFVYGDSDGSIANTALAQTFTYTSIDSSLREVFPQIAMAVGGALVEMMPAHVLGSICAPDLGVYLAGAIDVINTACTNYVPPQG